MAKRVAPLSALGVSRLKPDPSKTIEVVDGAVPGLRLRVTPSGTRTWSLNLRAKGVMRRFDVGTGLGLAEARQKADALRREVKTGADPTAARRAERKRTIAATLGIGTLGAVVDFYFETGPGAGLRTKHEQQQRIKSVFVEHLSRPSTDVVSTSLQLSIDAHPSKVSAARATAYLTPIIKWAKKRALMIGEFELEKPLRDAPRQRVLSVDELKVLLPTFRDAYGRCCKLMLLTGVRRDEARFATWGQFDIQAKVWKIPGEQRKDTRALGRRRGRAKEELVIPLSRQSIELLKEQRIAEETRLRLEEIAAEVSVEDPVFVGQSGGKLMHWDRWLKSKAIMTGVSGWSAHAMRRTAATLAGECGAAPHIVSVLLGHTNIGGELVAGYNKSRYLIEHADILQQVADKLEEFERGS